MFLPIFYLGLAAALFCYFRQAMDPYGRSISFGLFLLSIVNILSGGTSVYEGSAWAITIVFAVAFRLNNSLPRTMGTRLRVRF
jgi:hypothetical protein